ncbi:unnamed protein product [Closterium sp. Naga37s-1]|nr:unnamed protein product [Closterium sp. Naga37s-1]
MLCPDTAHLLLGNFCIYHIDAPGHEAGAEEISPLQAQLTASDLAEQVAEVMAWFRLPPAVCIGVGAGAYVLTLLALERPHAVQSLVLVSPVCRAASWGEWARSKVLLGVLCVAGMSKYVKDALVHRYFCHQQTGFHGPASDSILMFRQELDNREPENVMRYLDIIHSRIDLTPFLLHLSCPVLLVAGEMSEASMQEAAHMMCHLDPMTTPEELSMAALGVKLKPIRTRGSSPSTTTTISSVAVSNGATYLPMPSSATWHMARTGLVL